MTDAPIDPLEVLHHAGFDWAVEEIKRSRLTLAHLSDPATPAVIVDRMRAALRSSVETTITLEQIRNRWERGLGWPPGIHFNVTAQADVEFLLARIDRFTTALVEIGTRCSNYIDGSRCIGRMPDRSYWCSGCITYEVVSE